MDRQLIIFDLDGTLIDSRDDLAAAINHTRKSYALEPLERDLIVGYIGNGARKLVERSFAGSGVDVDEALARYKEYYNAHSTVETYCYAGVAEGLERLKAAGHALAVLTNKPGDAARSILAHYGLATFLDPVIGGGDGIALKPDPAGVYRCMARHSISPQHCFMVGDNYTDLEVALNAGVRSVYVDYGFGNPRDFAPDLRFKNFGELTDFFCQSEAVIS